MKIQYWYRYTTLCLTFSNGIVPTSKGYANDVSALNSLYINIRDTNTDQTER